MGQLRLQIYSYALFMQGGAKFVLRNFLAAAFTGAQQYKCYYARHYGLAQQRFYRRVNAQPFYTDKADAVYGYYVHLLKRVHAFAH